MAKMVEVPVDMLRSYMEEYHNPKPGGYCKADGQDWPCDVYKTLRRAVDSASQD